MCAFTPCPIKGFKKYASLFRKDTLLSVLCTPTFSRKVLILQGCIVSLKEVNILQEIIIFKEVIVL